MAKKAKKAAKKPAKKGAKKQAAKKAPLQKLSMDEMPPERQRAIFKRIEALLRQEGVTSELLSVQFDTNLIPLICVPPKVRRQICRKINGVVTCGPVCVDP